MTLKPSLFVFLGPPGAGKGAQAKKLSETLSLPHISTGDLLREESKKDTPFAQQLNKTLAEGHFLDDATIVNLIQSRINESDCAGGFILDGFPRTVSQAKTLDKFFSKSHNLIFVNIIISENTLLKRLMGRRVCSACSRTFHVDFLPPKLENICDYCESPLVSRSDDRKEVILKRFNIFKEKFAPMTEYYANRANWIEVKSEGTPEECFRLLMDHLEPILHLCANVQPI